MKGKVDFWTFICFSLGLGFKIRFWKDLWLGEVNLKEGFSNISMCLLTF